MSRFRIEIDQKELARLRNAIRELGDDKTKRQEVLKILRRQVKPAISRMQAIAPEAKKDVIYSRDKSVVFKPGNLKRSIKVFTGKNKQFPSVYVGPRAKGKPSGSGYYGYFVAYGTKGIRAIRRGKNNFIEKTGASVGNSVLRDIGDKTLKYIDKRAKQLGF